MKNYKKNTCQCGNTSNQDGTCDGTHLKTKL